MVIIFSFSASLSTSVSRHPQSVVPEKTLSSCSSVPFRGSFSQFSPDSEGSPMLASSFSSLPTSDSLLSHTQPPNSVERRWTHEPSLCLSIITSVFSPLVLPLPFCKTLPFITCMISIHASVVSLLPGGFNVHSSLASWACLHESLKYFWVLIYIYKSCCLGCAYQTLLPLQPKLWT